MGERENFCWRSTVSDININFGGWVERLTIVLFPPSTFASLPRLSIMAHLSCAAQQSRRFEDSLICFVFTSWHKLFELSHKNITNSAIIASERIFKACKFVPSLSKALLSGKVSSEISNNVTFPPQTFLGPLGINHQARISFWNQIRLHPENFLALAASECITWAMILQTSSRVRDLLGVVGELACLYISCVLCFFVRKLLFLINLKQKLAGQREPTFLGPRLVQSHHPRTHLPHMCVVCSFDCLFVPRQD